jgi:DNA primase
VRVAVVPAPHDPDSFIKASGGDAFRKLVENADDFFDYYLNRLYKLHDANSDKGRNAVLRGMAEALHKTGNAVLIDTYAQKTALRLGVSPEAVRTEFSKFKVQGSGSKAQDSESGEPALEPEAEASRPSPQEFWLLKLLLLHDDLVPWAALHLDVNWISHPAARQIVEHRLAAQTKETWKSLAAFLDECETPEMRSLVTEAVAEDRKIPNPDQQLADVTLKLRNQFLDRQIATLTHKVSQPEIPQVEQNELLHEREKLREQKRAPLK